MAWAEKEVKGNFMELENMGQLKASKSMLKSKSIWGGIMALIPSLDLLLPHFGIIPVGVLPDLLNIVLGTAGSLLAIWGRVKADRKIDKIF